MNIQKVKEGLLITATFKENEDILGGLLVSINGMAIDEMKQKIMPMMSYDNEVYLNRQFLGTFYMVGTPTGGSVDHFGSVSTFNLPNSKVTVQYSNKFIDLS